MNNANIRWPIQASSAPTRSQRAIRAIIALPVIATTFVMYAMVGRRSRQLKMPRPDAYVAGQVSVFQRLTSFGIAKLQGTAGATPQASHSVILHAPIIERGLCALQDVYNVLVDFRILNSSR